MIVAEMTERETVQVPAMGGIAKRTEICVMRCHDDQPAARSKQAMEVFHGPHYAGDMLDDVSGANFGKRSVGKGQGRLIQVRDHVGPACRMRVYADRARKFVDAAASVQYAAGLTYFSSILRHSSSVPALAPASELTSAEPQWCTFALS